MRLAPLAWLLTWTTYGTWLQGDPRGSYDRKAASRRGKFVAPNASFQALRRGQLTHTPLLIDPRMRPIVSSAIEAASEHHGWRLHALNIRSNHVHAVANGAAPEKMLQVFKARATRLLREERLIEHDRPVWTTSGSQTWLLHEEELVAAIDYVLNRQGPALPEG